MYVTTIVSFIHYDNYEPCMPSRMQLIEKVQFMTAPLPHINSTIIVGLTTLYFSSTNATRYLFWLVICSTKLIAFPYSSFKSLHWIYNPHIANEERNTNVTTSLNCTNYSVKTDVVHDLDALTYQGILWL